MVYILNRALVDGQTKGNTRLQRENTCHGVSEGQFLDTLVSMTPWFTRIRTGREEKGEHGANQKIILRIDGIECPENHAGLEL